MSNEFVADTTLSDFMGDSPQGRLGNPTAAIPRRKGNTPTAGSDYAAGRRLSSLRLGLFFCLRAFSFFFGVVEGAAVAIDARAFLLPFRTRTSARGRGSWRGFWGSLFELLKSSLLILSQLAVRIGTILGGVGADAKLMLKARAGLLVSGGRLAS